MIEVNRLAYHSLRSPSTTGKSDSARRNFIEVRTRKKIQAINYLCKCDGKVLEELREGNTQCYSAFIYLVASER